MLAPAKDLAQFEPNAVRNRTLLDLMDKVNLKDFQWSISQLRHLWTMADLESDSSPRSTISEKHAKSLQKLANALIPQLEILYATGSRRNLLLMVQEKDAGKLSYDRLAERAKAFDEHLRQELSETLIFSLGDKVSYFAPSKPLFGKQVEDQFPGLIDEINEAGKCYAFGRSTASVFHSIRCLESGIRALSRCLQIPDPTRAAERNWGKMLKTLKEDGIEKKWPTTPHRQSGDGEFFENAYAALASMQNPWRNATMHLDQKYTEEDALHIFDVVKGFMRRLASRMDENGKPFA
jgi:hypothetical protein